MSTKIKYIIISRHGERIDMVNKKNQILKEDDPELTKNGREQSEKMGEKLFLFFKNEKKIVFSKENLQIFSSPYSRTIQTSISLIKGYELSIYESKILNINNKILEMINSYTVSNFPKKVVALYNPPTTNSSLYKNQFEEFEKRKFSFKNDGQFNENELPIRYESEKEIMERIKSAVDVVINNGKEEDFFIYQFVSHAGIINYLYAYLNYLAYIKLDEDLAYEYINLVHDVEYNIDYNDSFIFKVEYDESDIKVEYVIKISL